MSFKEIGGVFFPANSVHMNILFALMLPTVRGGICKYPYLT